MNPRTVRKLSDLQIDEISLVDRPANQHGVVAIAKRADEENSMGIYDADGDEVDEQDLEHGDVVYNDDGDEFVFVEDAAEADDREPELVGKAGGLNNFKAGLGAFTDGGGQSGTKAYQGGQKARQMMDGGTKRAKRKSKEYMGAPMNMPTRGRALAYGGGAAATGYAVGKSLGESVLDDLSSALGQDDRDQVIAKAMDEVEFYKSHTEQLTDQVAALTEANEMAYFTEVAKSYGLPGDPNRLATVLKNAVDTMPQEDLDELDRLLTSQGSLYEELGAAGSGQETMVMGQVEQMAHNAVGKSDVTMEQATVALFDANPNAYEDYLAETGR